MGNKQKEVDIDDSWRNLQVSYDAINELDFTKKKAYMNVILNSVSLKGTQELAMIFTIDFNDQDTKDDIKEKILQISDEDRKLILLLNDFQKQKKRTISNYYKDIFNGVLYTTSLAQLVVLYNESFENLFSILTYHYWFSRRSGESYIFDKNCDSATAKKVLTVKGYKDKLYDTLNKASRAEHNYRLFSYVIINDERFIGLMYKEVKDTSIPDYDKGIRNKSVEFLLFGINTRNGIVEIKSKLLFEKRAIKEYFEETFSSESMLLKEDVFKSYNKQNILETMQSDKTACGTPVGDFLVDRIVLQSSSLKNSPEITFHTKNIDVWPTVADAYEKGAVNIASLKDLKSLSFKSMNVTRTIRSITKDNGNVVYTMNDSKINQETLESIKSKFYDKFGIPIFQEVTNHKFLDGRADLIDYVMGQSYHCDNLESEPKDIFNQLIEKKLLIKSDITYASCTDKYCPHQDQIWEKGSDQIECPLCDGELRFYNDEAANVNMSAIKKEIIKKVKAWCEGSDWRYLRNSVLTFGKKTINFIRVEKEQDGTIIQFFVADKTVDKRLLGKMHKMLTPTIVIFVGQQEKLIEHYSEECIQVMTFGKLYTLEEKDMKSFFEGIYKNLELRVKQYIASAANKAYHSIQTVLDEPMAINKESYPPEEFEDDGYALIKDMFSNSVKWGKEQNGQAVPEGVFSLSYLKHGRTKESYAFSFDFKLTYQKNGYDLDIKERRKAIDYVNDLNDSDAITSFTNQKELTGHIFISNQFNQGQFENVKEHFEKYLVDDVRTQPIFITAKTLAYLHARYRENIDLIELNKNYYTEQIFKALANKIRIVTQDNIDEVYENLLTRKYHDVDSIDMKRLEKEIKSNF